MAVSHLNSRPDRDTMIRRLRDFQVHWLEELEEWKQQGLTGEEQQSAQRFWIDLFRCFGIRSERVNLFERNVKRSSTGGRGRIDLFYPGVVIGEAKRPGSISPSRTSRFSTTSTAGMCLIQSGPATFC